MECDSVLGQQSISGKNVSLILCVWKPCYVKSGHICKLRPCRNKDTGVMNFRSVDIQRNCIIAIVLFVVINYQ